MKFPYYDPETNKEYDCENEYEFRIKSFTEKHDYNFWDDEVIEYAIEIKNEIISSLEKKSSKSDKIKVNYIKWIEKYIHGIHEFLIENNMQVPKLLENHKIFIYQTGKKKVGRPKGRSEQTDKKYDWILKKWLHQKKNKYAHTINEHAGLIRSQLKNNKPEFWEGDIYSKETIIDIIKKKKWGE